MAKEQFEVRSYLNDKGDYEVHATVQLDREECIDGKLPVILVLPDGLTAYRYLNHYNVEDGFFVSKSDLVITA